MLGEIFAKRFSISQDNRPAFGECLLKVRYIRLQDTPGIVQCESGSNACGLSNLIEVHHDPDCGVGDAIRIDHTTRHEKVVIFAYTHGREWDLVKRRVDARRRSPATMLHRVAGAVVFFMSIQVAQSDSGLVLMVNVNTVRSVGDRIFETTAGQDIVTGELIGAADVARLAQPGTRGKSGEGDAVFWNHLSQDVKNAAHLAAALKLDLGHVIGIGRVSPVDTGCRQHIVIRPRNSASPGESLRETELRRMVTQKGLEILRTSPERIPAGENGAGRGGLNLIGSVGAAAQAGGQIAVSRGVNKNPGLDGGATGFVFHQHSAQFSVLDPRRDEGSMEERFDGWFRLHHLIEDELKFLGIKGASNTGIGPFVELERATTPQPLHRFLRQPRNDLTGAGGVPERMPHAHQRDRRYSAKAIGALDQGDPGTQSGGADSSKHTGATSPKDANIYLAGNRGPTRRFQDRIDS